MAMRTVKVQGWGTGVAHLDVWVNNEENVFSGDVTLEPMTEDNSSDKTAPTLFSFDIPIDFEGVKQLKIKVDKAPVRFGQIVANYTEVEWSEIYYTGPYEFADIAARDRTGSRDPRSSVMIDRVLMNPDRQGLSGTWHWTVEPGQVFEHDLWVKQGSDLEF